MRLDSRCGRSVVLLLACGAAACGNKTLKDAQKYMDVKEYGKATELLELELQSDPKSVDAYLMLGKVRLILLDPEGAQKAFEKALLLSTKAKGQIAGIFLDAAKAMYGEKDDTGATGQMVGRYLEKATTYDPDNRRKVSAWALEEAAKAVGAEKTTSPIGLLKAAGRIDPEARKQIGSFALQTASSYKQKGFLPEAATWALMAGETSPDVLKEAAGTLREACVLLPLPEQAGLASRGLDKATQWDPSLEKDDELLWFRRFRLQGGTAEPPAYGAVADGAAAYLAAFPDGKHAEEARKVVAYAHAEGVFIALIPPPWTVLEWAWLHDQKRLIARIGRPGEADPDEISRVQRAMTAEHFRVMTLIPEGWRDGRTSVKVEVVPELDY